MLIKNNIINKCTDRTNYSTCRHWMKSTWRWTHSLEE